MFPTRLSVEQTDTIIHAAVRSLGLGGSHDAEDYAQEVWAHLCQPRVVWAVNESKRPDALTYVIARNCVLSLLKSAQRRYGLDVPLGDYEREDPDPDPADVVAAKLDTERFLATVPAKILDLLAERLAREGENTGREAVSRRPVAVRVADHRALRAAGKRYGHLLAA